MNDPYLNEDNCYERLRWEYIKHGRIIVAVDYDDTLFPYHNKDNTHNQIIDLLKICANLDFYIVIFTASAPERYLEIEEYCRKIELGIDSINKNPIPLKFGNHGKIYYNILLDDRAGLASAYNTLKRLVDEIIKDRDTQVYQDYIDRLDNTN